MGWCLDSGSQLGRGSENWLAGPRESQTSGSPNSCVWTGKSDGVRISHTSWPSPLESGRPRVSSDGDSWKPLRNKSLS